MWGLFIGLAQWRTRPVKTWDKHMLFGLVFSATREWCLQGYHFNWFARLFNRNLRLTSQNLLLFNYSHCDHRTYTNSLATYGEIQLLLTSTSYVRCLNSVNRSSTAPRQRERVAYKFASCWYVWRSSCDCIDSDGALFRAGGRGVLTESFRTRRVVRCRVHHLSWCAHEPCHVVR